ncbi:MAG: hypothetical protein M3P98_02110 [bacterium]|nr:hypothetical protein [bacterium]
MEYYLKQGSEPLFPELIWDKPETKHQAGKLLIVGGNSHEFAALGEAFESATKTGAGSIKILLPETLRKTIGSILDNTEYAPANKSGGFARSALAEWVAFGQWSNAVLIAGDLGRNSETGIVIETFLQKYEGLLTLTKDAVDYFTKNPNELMNRKQTTMVLSLAQLQKINTNLSSIEPITFDMPSNKLVECLHELTTNHKANIIVEHNGLVFVAVNGEVSTTKIENSDKWRVSTAAKASVWWMQNETKTFESLTTSLIQKV